MYSEWIGMIFTLNASYTPALAVSWAMFPLLALTAMRFKPALVL